MKVFNLLKTRIEEMEEKGDVEGLIHELNDESENVRREALMALERIGDSRATEPLIETLHDPDITIREEAITALGRIQDTKAVPPLIRTLNNQHIGIRWRAAEALGKIGDPQATEPLIQTLQDPDKTIQEEAITALGRISVDPYIQDLRSEDQQLKDNAIIALNNLIKSKITAPAELVEEKSDEPHIEPELSVKKKELFKKRYNVYIENFVKNSRYNYLDGFNRKSSYDYEFLDIKKLRDLLKYRGMEFSDEEVLSMIQWEIKNQEYLEFKEKILIQKPETSTDYIKTLIKTYPKPLDQTENLKKLLKEQNIPQTNLTTEIETIKQQIEITEFEDKILVKDAQTPDEKDSPSILKEFRKKELVENRNLMIANGKYVYIETFVRKVRYNYDFGDIRKFRELLMFNRINFSDDDLLWLIQEEIKNQEYLEFKEKILIQKLETSTDYIKTLIKTYPKPLDQTENLKKLLKEQNIPQTNLTTEIETIKQQIEITEFENKLLGKESSDGVLPVEMEDLDDAYISFNIGNLYYDFGKAENALSYYDKALYLYPDFVDAWKNIGLLYFTLGRLQKAAACYNQILLLDSHYPELWLDIGIIFYEIGRMAEAKNCYEKAMEMNPSHHSTDLALKTRKFLEIRPDALKKFDSYLEQASSAWWESSDPTPPLSNILHILNKDNKK